MLSIRNIKNAQQGFHGQEFWESWQHFESGLLARENVGSDKPPRPGLKPPAGLRFLTSPLRGVKTQNPDAKEIAALKTRGMWAFLSILTLPKIGTRHPTVRFMLEHMLFFTRRGFS